MLVFASGLVLLFVINAVLSDIDIDDDDQGGGGGGMMQPISVPT
jgi:hypothetical protein